MPPSPSFLCAVGEGQGQRQAAGQHPARHDEWLGGSSFRTGKAHQKFQTVDRTSFRRFLGLAEGDRVPDARTIWLFRERLAKSGKVGDLFQKFV
ncbi:MAG: transposase, partial [Bacteroidales bacterium]|nr:transposase [Bacteroidales bacterium]